MDPRYVFVYAAVNIFCILVSLIILSKIGYNVGSEQENRYFRGMALCFLAFVVLETIWVLAEGGILPIPRAVASSLKAIDTMIIPFKVYLWFWFAETKFRSKIAESRIARIITFIPYAILVCFYIASAFNGVVFSIGPEGELVPGPAVALTGLVDNIYGIAIILHAIVLFAKEKVPYRRRDYVTQIVFIVLCTAGGIIDAVVSGTPIMPLAIALAFVFLFSNLQESQIYNDALTGLNNRRRADEYMAESIEEASPENPLYLFVLDVDNFKEINDTRGHLEGDRALKAVARGIAKTTNAHSGFTARWGGDEFIIAVNGSDPNLPKQIESEIAATISEAAEEEGLAYSLAASIGCAKCTSPNDKIADLITVADEALYERKRQAKRHAA